MHVVAIGRLATSIEQEAQALAARFGTLAYAERQKLHAGLPAVVLSTPDPALARALAGELRARGHDVLTCDTADVVAAEDMRSLRRFRFTDDALVVEAELEELALPWDDLAVMLRATHRIHARTTTTVKDKKVSIGKALVTGGLLITKTTTRHEVSGGDENEPVLYLFRRSANPPWILWQHRAQYTALGGRATTAAPNFTRTVDELRARAPRATFDDRLLARRSAPDELDLVAHLLAGWLGQGAIVASSTITS